jgi:Zn-dependent M16 (insulinase) family peptidase
LLQTTAERLVHTSGAEVLWLPTDEANQTFAVGFPTLPSDDTGVAHILEHMVLAGSARFPVKDPFFDMIKGSVAGFINAFTYPDRTVYPFATENRADFANLLEVYLDAVFAPKLSELTFAQEAWHVIASGEPADWQIGGVVYNEMKGAMADPNRALSHAETAALFPATEYRFESGGDPLAMPDLSHDALVSFYRNHYAPSRARFVLHGNLDLDATLARIASYLTDAESGGALPVPAEQPHLAAPSEVTATYASDDEAGSLASVAWALPTPTGPDEGLVWEVLDHVLVGTPAAPVRSALLETGLGEAFFGGYSDGLKQSAFHVGLRGVAQDRTGEVHEAALAALRDVAENGIDAASVEAAWNSLEFDVREMDVHGGQRGLALAVDALGAWMHGRSPIHELDLDAAMERIRASGVLTPEALTEKVRTQLLANTHRADVHVHADPGEGERREEGEQRRLQSLAASLSDAERDELKASHASLMAHQQEPDPPEATATLPRLRRSDLSDIRLGPVLRDAEAFGDVPLDRSDVPTRGLVYFDAAFDLGGLATQHVPYLSLLGRLLLETGTQERSVADLTNAIDRDTGGLDFTVELASGVGGAPGLALAVLRGRALADKSATLVDLMSEVLTKPDWGDRDRIRRLAVESLSRRRTSIERAGHRFALQRVGAQLSDEGALQERLYGLASLDALAALIDRIDEDWATVQDELASFHADLVNRSRMMMHIGADDAADAALVPEVGRLVDAIPVGSRTAGLNARLDLPRREGWELSGQVHYLATGRPLLDGGSLPGSWLAAARWLSSDLLIPTVRLQGGAYGAGAMLDPVHGSIRAFSYRDPNLAATLHVFNAMPDRLREAASALSTDAFETLVIGAAGSLNPYETPSARGYGWWLRRLRGTSGEIERLNRELLAAGPDALAALADAMDAAPEPFVEALGPGVNLRSLTGDEALEVRRPG